MASKHPRAGAAAAKPGFDDFTAIEGIAETVQSRLWSAGFKTYKDIANSSVEKLAATSGLAAGRIKKGDWIGQAHKLASTLERTPADLVNEADIPEGRYTIHRFRVEMALDEANDLHHMQVVHLPNEKDEDHWPGWDEARLVRFFVERAGLKAPTAAPAPPHEVEAGPTEESDKRAVPPAGPSAEKPPTAPSPEAHVEEPQAELRLDIGDVTLDEVPASQGVDEQPLPKRLRTQINFQLAGQPANLLNAQQSPYVVQVLACNLATGQTTVLASAQHLLQPRATAVDQRRPKFYIQTHTTTVEFLLPDVGRYQLLATVVLPDSKLVGTALGPIFTVVL